MLNIKRNTIDDRSFFALTVGKVRCHMVGKYFRMVGKYKTHNMEVNIRGLTIIIHV